jgi:predicted Zn-dependent protease with MMP-like domain
MQRERFVRLVRQVLDSLPDEFREKIHNLAVIVEDRPPRSQAKRPRDPRRPRELVMGIFQGVPATQASTFNVVTGPNRIVLYQKNIEAVCSNEAEIRHEVRQTVLHELGHYFGMDESQLWDV